MESPVKQSLLFNEMLSTIQEDDDEEDTEEEDTDKDEEETEEDTDEKLVSSSQTKNKGKEKDENKGKKDAKSKKKDKKKGRKRGKAKKKRLPSASKWVLRYVYALNIYFYPTDDPDLVVPLETYPSETGMIIHIHQTQ